jgi:serine/threonine protein kinase
MDIKPSNILIDESKIIQYIDFGLSCTHTNRAYRKVRGTTPYMSPQMIKRKIKTFEHAKQSDIWSLGITIYKMVHGVLPWSSKTKTKLKREIRRVKQIKSKFAFCAHVIDNLLIRDIDQRWSLEEVV